MELNKVYLGDCLELLPNIPSKSIDMILCDLPYGTTSCDWDSIIPLDKLWVQYERVIKDNGVIVLTANSVFTFKVYASNPKLFRYKWVWVKSLKLRFLSANKMPLSQHEDILIFYKNQPVYNPQKTKTRVAGGIKSSGPYSGFDTKERYFSIDDGYSYPTDVLDIPNSNKGSEHPTQKPLALFEYLIKTYSNEGDVVLDNCAGSGTTAIACLETKRNFICMEKEESYFNVINNRIEKTLSQPKLF